MVCQRQRFSEAQQADSLNHFIRGGDLTAGGGMHAVTPADAEAGSCRCDDWFLPIRSERCHIR